MAVNIKLKRSNVPGQVPSPSSLELGELALNTSDGKAFMKKSDGNVIEIGAVSTSSISASYADTAGFAITAGSASYSNTATSSSYSLIATSASFAATASYAANVPQTASYAISASYASTASSADDFLVRGTLTAQTIVAQYITSSTSFITGSTKFGTLSSNTHEFTGSISVSGSLSVSGSNVILSNQTSSMSVATASFASTSSYVNGLNLAAISTGSIFASVDVDINNLFLIKSGSTIYFNISSSSNTTLYSDLFIIKNFTTQQPVLTVSQSIVQFATQSLDPTGTTTAGSIWFTSSSMYIGLEN
jgi:hypothetical protein